MQGDELRFAAVGDCQIATRHSHCRDQAFLDALTLIRDADVAYANLEHLVHDYGPECYPVFKDAGGTFTRAPPHAIEELRWMGFNMVSCATNHAFDYMVGGIKETVKNLKAGALAYAGIGMNLAEARAPAFFDSNQGRIGLISVAIGSDLTWSATDARRDMKGKPGINLIRVSKVYSLDPERFNTMKRIVNDLRPFGLLGARRTRPIPDDAVEFEVMMGRRLDGIRKTRFVLSDGLDVESIGYPPDVEGNLKVIDDARRQADWIFVTCHHHLTDGINRQIPAKAVQSFAHACIESGADGWIGSGPHQIQGIEIYEGKPIFYSLPDFIQQRDLVAKNPQIFYETFGLTFENTPMDAMDERARTVFSMLYDDSVHAESGIAVSSFNQRQVVEIRLYPINLGFQKPRWQFGRPKMAEGKMAEHIVDRWTKLSAQFGTQIDFEDRVGVIRLS